MQKTAILLTSFFQSLFVTKKKKREERDESPRPGLNVQRMLKAWQGVKGRVGRGEERGSQESCEYPIIGGYCGIITPLAAVPSKS